MASGVLELSVDIYGSFGWPRGDIELKEEMALP
jgi:hypothetical protein